MKFSYPLTTWPDANLVAAIPATTASTQKEAKHDFTTETIKAFKAKLNRLGITITQWSRDNNFNAHAVYRVINGYELGKKGKSLAIAQAVEKFALVASTDSNSH